MTTDTSAAALIAWCDEHARFHEAFVKVFGSGDGRHDAEAACFRAVAARLALAPPTEPKEPTDA